MLNRKKLRIIFLGTPPFAAFHLEGLLRAGFHIVAVITNVDKPMGRSLKKQISAVKAMAQGYDIPVLQPPNMKQPAFLEEVRSFRADVQVVVAFRMMPKALWDMPPLGTINMHASYLPYFRGAAPISWNIISGLDFSGVTTFQLRHEIDTGAILLRKKIPLPPAITAGALHHILQEEGLAILIQTLDECIKGTLQKTEQNIEEVPEAFRNAPKIQPEHCLLNCTQKVEEADRWIRALSPSPGVFTYLDGKIFKILAAKPHQEEHNYMPTTLKSDGHTYLHCYCMDGYLALDEVQMEGRKKMNIQSFLNGYCLKANASFSTRAM